MSAALAYQLPLEEQPLTDALSEKPRLGKKLRLVHSSDENALLSDCSTKRKSQIKLRCASAPLHGQIVGEYDQGGNPIQETIWFNSQPVATIKGPNIYYIHSDHLNTPRAITDNNNKVVWRWDSDPFGTTPANEDPDGDGTSFTYNLRFPGQYYDQESGLHYNYYRDYDPSTGRYIQADKLDILGRAHDPSLDVAAGVGLVSLPFNGFGSLETVAVIGATPLNHSYGYVNQNPIGDYDSNGLNPARAAIAIAIAAAKAMKKQIEKGVNYCKNIKCKIENHGPHHKFGFPFNERRPHIQLTCWRKGVKGSTFIIRFPY